MLHYCSASSSARLPNRSLLCSALLCSALERSRAGHRYAYSRQAGRSESEVERRSSVRLVGGICSAAGRTELFLTGRLDPHGMVWYGGRRRGPKPLLFCSFALDALDREQVDGQKLEARSSYFSCYLFITVKTGQKSEAKFRGQLLFFSVHCYHSLSFPTAGKKRKTEPEGGKDVILHDGEVGPTTHSLKWMGSDPVCFSCMHMHGPPEQSRAGRSRGGRRGAEP